MAEGRCDKPRIGFEPIFIVGNKILITRCFRRFISLFLEESLEVFKLHAAYGFVVAVRQCVEFLTTTQELRHLRLGTQNTRGLQIDIMWMKCAGANDVVRIGIVPMAISRRIVDRQQLDDLHARLRCPINHPAQIAEVAYPIGMFATKGEYWDDDTCCPPRVLCQAQMTTMQDEDVTVREFAVSSIDGIDGHALSANRHDAVVALLPFQQFVRLGVYHYIFILYRQQPALCIDGQEPFTLTGIIHLQITAGAPRTDGRMTATDGYGLPLLQLGC